MEEVKRNKYSKIEQMMHEVLKNNFYLNGENDKKNHVKKNEDVELQKLGLDANYYSSGLTFSVDEKVAIERTCGELDSFCLELTNEDKFGNQIFGWFLNPECINNSYVFVWIDEANECALEEWTDSYGKKHKALKEDAKPEDIKKFSAVLLMKRDLKNILSEKGYDDNNKILQRLNEMQKNSESEGCLRWIKKSKKHGDLVQIDKFLLELSSKKIQTEFENKYYKKR